MNTVANIKAVKNTLLWGTSKVSLKKHSRKHIKKNIYKCEFPGCGHEFLQMRNLTIHQRLHVSDLLF